VTGGRNIKTRNVERGEKLVLVGVKHRMGEENIVRTSKKSRILSPRKIGIGPMRDVDTNLLLRNRDDELKGDR